jgi:hypothetical protein
MTDAAKSCIDVLIVRLKPVAESGAQHACSGASAAAFHNKVFAVKEVG